MQVDELRGEPINDDGRLLVCQEEDGSYLELRTLHAWDLVGQDLIRNTRFGSFRRNQGMWVFSGSYDDPAWVKIWRSRYLVDRSLPLLLGSVERLIALHLTGHDSRRTRQRILVFVLGMLSAGALVGWFAATRPLF